jgi:hypothetical protein
VLARLQEEGKRIRRKEIRKTGRKKKSQEKAREKDEVTGNQQAQEKRSV